MMHEPTILQCSYLACLIEPQFRGIRKGSEMWNYKRAMILFLFGSLNSIHEPEKLYQKTRFHKPLVFMVCKNLQLNGIWQDGFINADIFNEETGFMEVVCCSMCAIGQLKRYTEPEPFKPAGLLPLNVFSCRYDFNEHEIFKIQKERENRPYEFNYRHINAE